MELDEALQSAGDIGRFQVLTFALLFIPVFHESVFTLSYVFTARDLSYRCRVPECEENGTRPVDSTPSWLPSAIPLKPDGSPGKCSRYAPKPDKPDEERPCTPDTFTNETIVCYDWVYATDDNTIVREFNITCEENRWKLTLIGSVNSLAQQIGLPINGVLSDKYGRKRTLLALVLFSLTFGISRSIAPSYYTFLMFEFLDAFFASGIYCCCFILGVEFLGDRLRMAGASVMASFYTIGSVILGIAAWYENDWRNLLRLVYGPTVTGFLCVWMIPESVRWLVSVNKNEEAEKVLARVAKINGRRHSRPIKISRNKRPSLRDSMTAIDRRRPSAVCGFGVIPVSQNPESETPSPLVPLSPQSPKTMSDDEPRSNGHHSVIITDTYSDAKITTTRQEDENLTPERLLVPGQGSNPRNDEIRMDKVCESVTSETNRSPFVQVFRSRVLMSRLLITAIIWVVNTFVYFGLALNSVSIGGNLYLNFILTSLIEIPAFVITYLTSARWGRKKAVACAFVITGSSLLGFLVIPPDLAEIRTGLYLIGKLGITWSFTVTSVLTTELFPTNIRQSIMGICGTVGRFGCVIAPQLPLLERYWSGFPVFLFGTTSLSAAALMSLLPETLNKTLPDNIRQAEEIGKKNRKPT